MPVPPLKFETIARRRVFVTVCSGSLLIRGASFNFSETTWFSALALPLIPSSVSFATISAFLLARCVIIQYAKVFKVNTVFYSHNSPPNENEIRPGAELTPNPLMASLT
jgi:hypothetical protein